MNSFFSNFQEGSNIRRKALLFSIIVVSLLMILRVIVTYIIFLIFESQHYKSK